MISEEEESGPKVKEDDEELNEEKFLEETKNRKRKKITKEEYELPDEPDFPKKVKNKEKEEDDNRRVEEKVGAAKDILMRCIYKDKESQQKGLPAIEKLKCLPHILKILYKPNYSFVFLQSNGLSIIQEFLRKNQDGSFPCLNQIDKVLTLLDDLPITKEHLEDCEIGNIVSTIVKQLQNGKIQRKAKNLYEKWFRIASGVDNSYSIENENKIYSQLFLKKKRAGDDKMDSKAYYEKLNENRKIPQKALFDFTYKPESKQVVIKEDERIARKNYWNPIKKGNGGTTKKHSLLITSNEI